MDKIQCQKNCGMCCKVLILQYDITAYSISKKGSNNWSFAKRNFVPITEKQAFKINPHLKDMFKEQKEKFYYRCKMFSEYTKRCSVYEIRPTLCRAFPVENYGIENYKHKNLKKIDDTYFYSKTCVYLPIVIKTIKGLKK